MVLLPNGNQYYEDVQGKVPGKHCKVCNKNTHGGKPLCPEHSEQMPYVQKILKELEKDDPTEDILTYLKFNGPRTMPRIQRDINLECEATILELWKQKVLKRCLNARGDQYMYWINDGR